MLKDYVGAQEALIDLADKLKAIKNETILIDCQQDHQSAFLAESPLDGNKLARFLTLENVFLSEKIKALNASIVGRDNSTRQSLAPEPNVGVPTAQFASQLAKY